MNHSQPTAIEAGWASGRSTTLQLLAVLGFSLATAIGAQIEIPHAPVPFTFQSLFVLLSGAILGKRNGAISQGMYILAGLAGAPVFSGFGFGLARILGPTGGYLLAFPLVAFVVGFLLERRSSFAWTLLSMAAGLVVLFSLGTLHLHFFYYHDLGLSITNGFLIFSWWDVVKLIAAATIVSRTKSLLRRV
jgi:biotin transport system substrate-specific component